MGGFSEEIVFDHEIGDGLGQEERAFEIGREHFVPAFCTGFE